MWATELYAISALRSVWRRQIRLAITVPHSAMAARGESVS